MNLFMRLMTLCVFIVSFSAFSLTVDEAKEQGVIGETLSGYLAVVNLNNQAAVKLVNEVNHDREIKYGEIALKNNLETKDVAKIAGQKLVDRAGKGEYVRGINGQWLKTK